MDIHIWGLLCNNCVHTLLSQLPDLVISWAWDDHVHCLVHEHSNSSPWPGGWCGALESHKASALFHRRHQYTLHLWWICCHCVDSVEHLGPQKLMLYLTGATNILDTFGGHAVTVEIMHAMWKSQKFMYIYMMATLYVFMLTLPSASSVYWAFGDKLLNHLNAFSLLPKTRWRDAAVILVLIHQFITVEFACTPLYFVWEKVIGMHDTKSICLRALAGLPVVIPIWFLAIVFAFFGPINSAVGALLVSFTVYIIPLPFSPLLPCLNYFTLPF